MGSALEGYLYTSDDNLNIGAAAAGKVVRFLAGGSNTGSNTILTLASTGATFAANTVNFGTGSFTAPAAAITHTGAFAQTFTATAATNVTLPAGTKTLLAHEFETVSKNLRAHPATLTYASGVLTSIAYNTGAGTITKTLNYTSGILTSIVLSGSTPAGIAALTKTLTYTSGALTGITYS